jgi:hypothetical protein
MPRTGNALVRLLGQDLEHHGLMLNVVRHNVQGSSQHGLQTLLLVHMTTRYHTRHRIIRCQEGIP